MGPVGLFTLSQRTWRRMGEDITAAQEARTFFSVVTPSRRCRSLWRQLAQTGEKTAQTSDSVIMMKT
jgi:hypothetical protein